MYLYTSSWIRVCSVLRRAWFDARKAAAESAGFGPQKESTSPCEAHVLSPHARYHTSCWTKIFCSPARGTTPIRPPRPPLRRRPHPDTAARARGPPASPAMPAWDRRKGRPRTTPERTVLGEGGCWGLMGGRARRNRALSVMKKCCSIPTTSMKRGRGTHGTHGYI